MKKYTEQFFTIILEVDSFDWDISHRTREVFKNWPEIPVHESFKAKPKILYSDNKKYAVDDVLNLWISTDYEYIIYHIMKDKRFIDDRRPDQPFASIDYDEYKKRLEETSKKIVGSINGDYVSLKVPLEIANRLAVYKAFPLYLDLHVYREKGRHIILINSVNISSSINISDYTG